MTVDPTPEPETPETGLLQRKFKRSQLLKAAGAGAVVAAIPRVVSAQSVTTTTAATGANTVLFNGNAVSLPFYPRVTTTYTPETLPTILNIAQTMEYLATTLVNAAVTRASTLGISGLTLQALQAALAEEVYHVQFLAITGAIPMTTTFTVPDPAILTNATTFFRALELLETICNAAYLTANREFAELGQPLLAKFAYQAGSVEAEHRVAARTALALMMAGTSGTGTTAGPGTAAGTGAASGTSTTPTGSGTGTPGFSFGVLPAPFNGAAGTAAPAVSNPIPPNNKAFETDYFLYLADAAALVKALGFIGGTGTALTFPGTATALTNAGTPGALVLQQLPNNATTSITTADVRSALSAIGATGIIAQPSTGTGSGTGTS